MQEPELLSHHSTQMQIRQFGAISRLIQMSLMQVTGNEQNKVHRVIQPMQERELLSNHLLQMHSLPFAATLSLIQM
jgi:hypothetical protein